MRPTQQTSINTDHKSALPTTSGFGIFKWRLEPGQPMNDYLHGKNRLLMYPTIMWWPIIAAGQKMPLSWPFSRFTMRMRI